MQDKDLYRGKRLDNGEWVYGQPMRYGEHRYIVSIEIADVNEEYISPEWWQPVGPDTVGQCTGVKDKNGKLIFEGDVYHQGDKNIKYVVVWHDSGLIGKQLGSSSYAGLSHWRDRIETIGNIHDRTEEITC